MISPWNSMQEVDRVIDHTIQIVDQSKSQIFNINEGARQEAQDLEIKLQELKEEVKRVIEQTDHLEKEFKRARLRLVEVSRNLRKYTEEDIREAYEQAHDIQVRLTVSKEKERMLRKEREEAAYRLKNLNTMIQRAENVMTQMSVVMEYLSGDIRKISEVLESAHNLQNLGLQVIQAQEEERKRVSRDIHDGPAQSMANVLLRTDFVEKMLKQEHRDAAQEELSSLKGIVRESLADVRKIIFDLRPMALDDLGLVPTLRKFIERFEHTYGLRVDLVTFGQEKSLPSTMETAVFRLVQESLTNAAKHAEASEVKVTLEYSEQALNIVVQDNGSGFDVEKVEKKSEGYGLMGMKERAQLIHGKMNILSTPGKGTRIIFSISLNEE